VPVTGERPDTAPRNRSSTGKRHAEPRPQDHNDDVGAARRRDVVGVLKMAGRDQRLALQQHRLDVEVIREFAVEPGDDLLGFQPLRPNVGGRGDEDADASYAVIFAVLAGAEAFTGCISDEGRPAEEQR